MTTEKKEEEKKERKTNIAERKEFFLEREKWNIGIGSVASNKDEI
jgi:hypothetical protein